MGCSGSTAAATDQRISPASAQSIFKLEGLPLTLTVAQLDSTRLELRIVGLDCQDELKRLEAALQKRLLILRSATLLKVGSHVDQTFELALKRKRVSPIKDYLSKPLPNRVEITQVTAKSVREELPEAAAGMSQKEGTLLRLFVQCGMKGGERGLIAESMAKHNLALDCASLKTLDGNVQTVSDTYWMSTMPPSSESDTSLTPQQLCEEFKFDLFSHLQSMASLQAVEKKQKIASMSKGPGQSLGSPSEEHSDPYGYAALEHSANSRVSRTTSNNSMTGFMKGQLGPALKADADELPIALQWTRKKLEYAIHPSTVGFVVDGFKKFVGMGLVQRSMQEMLSGKKDDSKSLVLEMRSFFISTKQASASGHLAQFSHVVHDAVVGTPDYSHFVTWLNLAECTWTIDRVFLNDVLPAGNGYGAKAICEHLLAPPDLFFHTASSTLSQLGSFLESLPDLKKIVVCDIINWNTYMLMAVAGSTEEEAKAKLGDVLDFALQSELQNAKLSRKQLFDLSLLQVFQHTALGKLCSSVLKKWNAELGRNIKMESAEVVFGQGDEEMFGQRRPRMAVLVHLATDASGAMERSKVRLATASERLLPQVSSLQFGGQTSEMDTAHWWGGLPPEREHQSENPGLGLGKSRQSLEQMGEFLEESWGEDCIDFKNLAGQAHEGSTASFFFASMASGMTRLMHEMQVERGLSCRAVAAAAEGAAEGAASVANERMKSQRGNTDKALRQLLELLKITSTLVELGRLGLRHKDVLELQELISIGILVQRGLVDDAIAHPIIAWMERYLMVCSSGETAYHVLIGKLLHGIVRAIHFALEDVTGTESSKDVAERCAILLRSKEQVGQERALLAAKGKSRWVEKSNHRETFDTIKKGSLRLAKIIQTEDLQWSAPENKLLVVKTLEEMHSSYEKEAAEPAYSIPSSKAIAWFELLTRWIDAAYDQIQEEIENITEQLPEDNVAKPCADVALIVPEPAPTLDAGDEQVGRLISELKSGKFSKVVVMAGAGISVSANLPDFRSKGGLYDQLRHTTNITSPETIFTRQFLRENPQLFFEVMQKLRVDEVNPTLTHEFLKVLQNKRMLQRLYTQNIDSLERKVGMDEADLIECHGTTLRAKCDECRKVSSREDYFEWKGEGVPRCSCGGFTRPDIVLFGESLPPEFHQKSKTDFQEADLLIIMGTSLQVQPFASLPKLVKPDCAILVINREMPRSFSLHRQVRSLKYRLSGKKLRKEVFLQGECDTSIRWLAGELGWTKELDQVRQISKQIIST